MTVENRDRSGLLQQLTTYKTVIVAFLMVIGGGVTMYASNKSEIRSDSVWAATLSQLGGLLVATGLLAVIWDLWAKRAFMHEVLEKVNLASDVHAAGIDRVTMDWKEISWKGFFASAKNVEVFIAYGSSWRKNNWQLIQEFASKKNRFMDIYLPDPSHEATMTILAHRYQYTEDLVKQYVQEAARDFAKLNDQCEAEIRVYYRVGDPTYTCYRFDEKYLVTLYANRRERGNVPTLLFDVKGTFGEFFKQDLAAIRKQSDLVSLQQLTEEENGT